mmetsp:Transcript_30848/g.80726  ORF Transcript_30848/g.80726 Transcript_30848/m.80726 type:complete len:110 (+) Transcript_30848:917-1246(+)
MKMHGTISVAHQLTGKVAGKWPGKRPPGRLSEAARVKPPPVRAPGCRVDADRANPPFSDGARTDAARENPLRKAPLPCWAVVVDGPVDAKPDLAPGPAALLPRSFKMCN